MSVSFFAVQPIIGYRNECSCGKAKTGLYYGYKGAQSALENNPPLCGDEDCAVYGGWTTAVEMDEDAPTVNMSNINAREVLLALGYISEDLTGSKSGSDLLDDTNRALALADFDEGRESQVMSRNSEGQPNMVLCGRRPGYVQSRLDDIRAVAQFAADRGYEVSWG